MIYNLPRTTSTNNTKPQQMTVEMKPVMKVFLSQLKLLLGMMPVVRSSGTFNCFRVRIWECFQYDCERVIYPCGTAAERFVEQRDTTAVLLRKLEVLRYCLKIDAGVWSRAVLFENGRKFPKSDRIIRKLTQVSEVGQYCPKTDAVFEVGRYRPKINAIFQNRIVPSENEHRFPKSDRTVWYG